MDGVVEAVHRSALHTMKKHEQLSINLLTGLGVEGDAHMGDTVKHRSRVAVDPNQPNLRQVHLIHSELYDELRAKGFTVYAGEMGEMSDNKLFVAVNTLVSLIQKPFKSFTIGALG
jgi:hypothetical protein